VFSRFLSEEYLNVFIIDPQRPLSAIPKRIVILFVLGLLLQISWYQAQSNISAQAEKLPTTPASGLLNMVSMGEPIALAKILMLWLQSFDNQPGISIPFVSLDYTELEQWFARIIELDPESNYALLSASRIYTEVPDQMKQRQMMNFVYEQFLQNPEKNWMWLAHVTVLAKHRLKDSQLALKYAHALADKKLSNEVPAWVRQLEIVVLEDVGELDAVRLLVGGLIESQSISDTKELMWLEQRLKELEANESVNSH